MSRNLERSFAEKLEIALKKDPEDPEKSGRGSTSLTSDRVHAPRAQIVAPGEVMVVPLLVELEDLNAEQRQRERAKTEERASLRARLEGELQPIFSLSEEIRKKHEEFQTLANLVSFKTEPTIEVEGEGEITIRTVMDEIVKETQSLAEQYQKEGAEKGEEGIAALAESLHQLKGEMDTAYAAYLSAIDREKEKQVSSGILNGAPGEKPFLYAELSSGQAESIWRERGNDLECLELVERQIADYEQFMGVIGRRRQLKEKLEAALQGLSLDERASHLLLSLLEPQRTEENRVFLKTCRETLTQNEGPRLREKDYGRLRALFRDYHTLLSYLQPLAVEIAAEKAQRAEARAADGKRREEERIQEGEEILGRADENLKRAMELMVRWNELRKSVQNRREFIDRVATRLEHNERVSKGEIVEPLPKLAKWGKQIGEIAARHASDEKYTLAEAEFLEGAAVALQRDIIPVAEEVTKTLPKRETTVTNPVQREKTSDNQLDQEETISDTAQSIRNHPSDNVTVLTTRRKTEGGKITDWENVQGRERQMVLVELFREKDYFCREFEKKAKAIGVTSRDEIQKQLDRVFDTYMLTVMRRLVKSHLHIELESSDELALLGDLKKDRPVVSVA